MTNNAESPEGDGDTPRGCNLSLRVRDGGTRLTVDFPLTTYPDLFGWETYRSRPSPEGTPSWYVLNNQPTEAIPTFTMRGDGRFAPYRKAVVHEWQESVSVEFEGGREYPAKLGIRI